MNPTDLAELRQALEPREATEAEAAQIERMLGYQEASLRTVEADRRKWERPVWRLWRMFGSLLCAPWRLIVALRTPPDQC